MGPFETGRLWLRRFREADFDDIYRLIYTDPDVYGQYSTLGEQPAMVRSRVLHYAHEPDSAQFGRLAVERKDGGALIGQVHLDPYVSLDYRVPGDDSPFNTVEVELAFAFGKEYWGQGYAYEACCRLVDYAFLELKLPRLIGGARAGNTRSLRLHERLGYRLEPNPDPTGYLEWVAILENTRL